MKICGIGNLQCVLAAEKRLQLGSLRKKLNKENPKKLNTTRRYFGDYLDDCNCLPMCSDLSYHTETSQSYWEWEDDFKTYNGTFDLNRNE